MVGFRFVAARWVLVIAIVSLAGPTALADTRRVLMLHSFGRDVEAHAAFSRGFRTELAASSGHPIEFYELSLATALLDGGAAELRFVDYLVALDARNPFDLVVTIGGPAARFVQRHRGEIFATTPTVIASTDIRHLKDQTLTELDAVVPVRIDLRGIFDNILRVLPDTREVLVVLGTSPLEQFWVQQVKDETRPLLDRVKVTYLDAEPLGRILERVARAPAGTAVFIGMLARDADGVPYGEQTGLAEIHAVSRVPVFGVFDYQLGNGIVGGPLIPIGAVAKQTARVARSILAGEPPSRFRPDPPAPVVAFDAGELDRWGIPRSRLPEGADLRFVKPSFWGLYRWHVLVVAVVCLGQGLIILGLLRSRARLRGAEVAIRDVSRRLISVQEDERARLARELHDDVTQRLARLAIDAGRVEMSGGCAEGSAATVRDLRVGLVRLSEDVHVLSYNLHPSILDDLGLVEAIRAECDRISERGIAPVEVVTQKLPPTTPGFASRCLFRVAQEALRNAVRHAAARTLQVGLYGEDRGIRLIVRDDGVGFDPSAPRSRPTLGLASMRERVRMVGGSFAVESWPGQGTTISAWVPLEGPSA